MKTVTVRTRLEGDGPLDLKTHVAKDVTGVDLSTFQTDTGQGRSASRESSQSFSAGSETGSLSGCVRESSVKSNRLNPDNYASRRKRHINENSVKVSPNVSPPPSRHREGERREPHDSPCTIRSQYTLGASASKLARRISNELEKQGANPAMSDQCEIQSRQSIPNHSPSPLSWQDNNVTHHRQFAGDFAKRIGSVKDPPNGSSRQTFDSIDLSRVKEEVIEDDQLFEQLDWTRGCREASQDNGESDDNVVQFDIKSISLDL